MADSDLSQMRGTLSPGQIEALLTQLHICEYQALTNRCTYLITMQYALWPVLFVSLPLLGFAWDKFSHVLLMWIALLVAEIVSVGWYFTACEVYLTVRYLESELRPIVQKLLADDSFWKWELWLAARRGRGPQWFECWVSILVGMLFISLAIAHPPHVYGYWSAFLVNLVGLILILLLNIQLARMRQKFFSR